MINITILDWKITGWEQMRMVRRIDLHRAMRIFYPGVSAR
jgi:hypothetical protein